MVAVLIGLRHKNKGKPMMSQRMVYLICAAVFSFGGLVSIVIDSFFRKEKMNSIIRWMLAQLSIQWFFVALILFYLPDKLFNDKTNVQQVLGLIMVPLFFVPFFFLVVLAITKNKG